METTTPEEISVNDKRVNDATEVACIMIATMSSELQKYYEDYCPHKMNFSFCEMFHKKSKQQRYEFVKALMVCK